MNMKAVLKTIVGTMLLPFYRVGRSALAHVLRREAIARFAHCEPDLDLSFPWDIRGFEYIYIGHDVFLGPSVLLIADNGAEIHIGAKVMFGPGVRVIASDHRFDDPSRPIKDSGYGRLADVRIGRDVWIGAGATILRGVIIGDGSVVGAGSVVTRCIGEREVWAGNPARKIRDRFRTEKAAHS